MGATEVCLQGGIHPDFDGDYYIDVTRAVQEAAPGHPRPRLHRARGHRRRPPPGRAARSVPDAGSWTPGSRRCPAPRPRSSTTRSAPCSAPTRSTPTSGSTPTGPPTASACGPTSPSCSAPIEQPVHWARHLVRTRDLQKETGGFTEFVPLPFVHMAVADLPPEEVPPRARPSARRCSCTRSAGSPTDGWIHNIQASWVKLGLGRCTPDAAWPASTTSAAR